MSDYPARPDGRRPDELRPVSFTLNYAEYPEGSAPIKVGRTHVLCNVSVEERVPGWMYGSGSGWLTAEYAMLPVVAAAPTGRCPRSTHTRARRETRGLRSRTHEIRRLKREALR